MSATRKGAAAMLLGAGLWALLWSESRPGIAHTDGRVLVCLLLGLFAAVLTGGGAAAFFSGVWR